MAPRQGRRTVMQRASVRYFVASAERLQDHARRSAAAAAVREPESGPHSLRGGMRVIAAVAARVVARRWFPQAFSHAVANAAPDP